MSIMIRHRQPNGDLKRDRKKLAHNGKRAVYVMRAEWSGCVKVGSSVSPASRAATIETGSPMAVYVAAVVWLEPEDANHLERSFHAKFCTTKRHMRGEWYAMTPGEACYELWHVAEGIGLAIRFERGMDFEDPSVGGFVRNVVDFYGRRLERKRYG